jgi:hypothetical protein
MLRLTIISLFFRKILPEEVLILVLLVMNSTIVISMENFDYYLSLNITRGYIIIIQKSQILFLSRTFQKPTMAPPPTIAMTINHIQPWAMKTLHRHHHRRNGKLCHQSAKGREVKKN